MNIPGFNRAIFIYRDSSNKQATPYNYKEYQKVAADQWEDIQTMNPTLNVDIRQVAEVLARYPEGSQEALTPILVTENFAEAAFGQADLNKMSANKARIEKEFSDIDLTLPKTIDVALTHNGRRAVKDIANGTRTGMKYLNVSSTVTSPETPLDPRNYKIIAYDSHRGEHGIFTPTDLSNGLSKLSTSKLLNHLVAMFSIPA